MKKHEEWCHKAVFVIRIVKIIVLDIFLALTTSQAKNIGIALAITKDKLKI